jgi:hypothetical protein
MVERCKKRSAVCALHLSTPLPLRGTLKVLGAGRCPFATTWCRRGTGFAALASFPEEGHSALIILMTVDQVQIQTLRPGMRHSKKQGVITLMAITRQNTWVQSSWENFSAVVTGFTINLVPDF